MAHRHNVDQRGSSALDEKYENETLQFILDALERVGLAVSGGVVRRTMDAMREPHRRISTGDELVRAIDAITSTVESELSSINFIQLDGEAAKYYEQQQSFGEAVAARFPAAGDDIEEAGNCFALGRATACVYHLMRVMEVGLKELAQALKIPYAPSWESYLSQIEKQIAAKHKSKSKKWKAAEPFYRDVVGDLQAVKIAWRNPTMHIVRRYTPQEAEDVFRAVRTLMQRLAIHCPV